MGKIVGIKEAAKIVGLSEWELRRGSKAGVYPHHVVGGSGGKYIYDVELLENHLKELMLGNVKKSQEETATSNYGKIRAI